MKEWTVWERFYKGKGWLHNHTEAGWAMEESPTPKSGQDWSGGVWRALHTFKIGIVVI